jgi:zinc D-Ala-D-Ala dipeptidase
MKGVVFVIAVLGLALSAKAQAIQEMPTDFVPARQVAPLLVEDMRYATANNFTGAVLPGYGRGVCWTRREVATRLRAASEALQTRRLRLVAFDCYRPERAVAAFVRWANDASDQRTKAQYYPRINKPDLLGPWIAPRSGHSRGTAVDVGLMDASGRLLDCGTPFDFFDTQSGTSATGLSAGQRECRTKLAAAMTRAGFTPYANEWWHYSVAGLPNVQSWDAPIN